MDYLQVIIDNSNSYGFGIAYGDLVYLNTSNLWNRTDADSSNTIKLIGVALGTSSVPGAVLLRGFVRATAYSSFSTGVPLYVSRTSGDFVSTLSGFAAGDYVRLMGYKVATNTIYFNPDNTWVEL